MRLLDGQTIGIDLGTTFCAVSQLNDGGVPVSLKNADGQITTPSIVVLGNGGQIVVGPTPDRLAVEDPNRIVSSVKREMGNKSFFKIYQNKKLTAEFLSALILKKLTQDAERQIGKIANAVITVPYYFNDHCRKATQDAGQIAGLNVLDILNEPTAATLAYAWLRGELGRPDPRAIEKRIMVYDLGGGTFDVTYVTYTPTHFQVVATDGDVRLGGLDWTQRLVDYVAQQFKAKFGVDPRSDPRGLLECTQVCESAKRILSSAQQTTVSVFSHGKSLSVNVTRQEFASLTADLLQRTRDTTELVLQQAGVDPRSIDAVLLVGGSTHMPAVEKMLTDVCGREPSHELDPDVAVAQGAAIHGAILEAKLGGDQSRVGQAVLKRLRSVTTSDVNSHSLGVEIANANGRRNHIMIPRNTPIPHKVVQRFVTNMANPRAIQLRLLEGEVADVDACTFIGDFRIIGLPPNLPAGSPVELTFCFDAQGRIHASARELTGNVMATTEIVRDQGLTDGGLEAFRTLASEYHVE